MTVGWRRLSQELAKKWRNRPGCDLISSQAGSLRHYFGGHRPPLQLTGEPDPCYSRRRDR
jgi:hypothetical protein